MTLARFAFTALFLLIATVFAQAQQSGVLFPGEPTNIGAEVVVVSGLPAYKFISRTGSESYVYLKKYNEQDAFAFPVVRCCDKLSSGWLYVMKDRIAFDPNGDKSKQFDVARSEMKKVKVEHKWNGEHHISIKPPDGKERIYVINFIPVPSSIKGLGGAHQKPVLDLFEAVIANFDSAVEDFNKYTAKLRQTPKP